MSSKKIHIGPKKKIAFVCSGGASKAGAFHLGVALALREQGFKFFGGVKPDSGDMTHSPSPGPMTVSSYVGSSAGSIITTFLAAGFSLDNIFNSFLGRSPVDTADMIPRVLPKLSYKTMFRMRSTSVGQLARGARDQISQVLLLRKLVSNLMNGEFEALLQLGVLRIAGIFSTDGIEQYMREEALPSNDFKEYLADLFIVATQLNHSRKVVFGKYTYQPPPHDLTCQYNNDTTLSRACAASTALPFIYAPYGIKNENGKTIYYIDGEIRETLSTHVAVDSGADLIIASYTHQPYHYMKEIGSLTERGLPTILIQSIYLLIEQKINAGIHNKTIQRKAIQAVSKYCKQQDISEEHRRRICEIMEAELHHRTDVDTIYIHPRASDAPMFFGEHFTLSPTRLSEYVRCGFRAGLDVLRKYEFSDRELIKKPEAQTS